MVVCSEKMWVNNDAYMIDGCEHIFVEAPVFLG